MLEFFEEVFDQMPCLVERLVVVSRYLAVGFLRDDRLTIGGLQRVKLPCIGVIALVGELNFGFDLAQQNVGAIQVVGLPRRQMKADGFAQSIADCVDFGAQTAL